MSAVIIAGIGTDIGKTYASCALLRGWRAQGQICRPLKPVLSGYEEATLAESDAAKLLVASGQEATPETIAAMCPWRYRAPLAPPAAAKLEGDVLDFEAIAQFCRAAIASNADAISLVETAGGVMSPLSHNRTMLDLVAALGAPVILVAGSYLGAVSHTLTALEALRARDQWPVALVVNESEGGVGLDETHDMLAAFHPDLTIHKLTRNGELRVDVQSLGG